MMMIASRENSRRRMEDKKSYRRTADFGLLLLLWCRRSRSSLKVQIQTGARRALQPDSMMLLSKKIQSSAGSAAAAGS